MKDNKIFIAILSSIITLVLSFFIMLFLNTFITKPLNDLQDLKEFKIKIQEKLDLINYKIDIANGKIGILESKSDKIKDILEGTK